MSDTKTSPLVRASEAVEYESVDAADGLRKGVLIGEEDGGGTLAIRRFTLAPGGEVPRHTNEIEHEQYVLEGEYVVGISEASETPRADGEAVDGGEEHTVSAGDALHIPAGAVHWYRNESEKQGAFICAVPAGDDEIQLVED
ncbi:MAG: cupin domain-containing protein [Haloarculaceae archaeon]